MKQYNVQEVGLGKALVDRGWNVDFFLLGKDNSRELLYRNAQSGFYVQYLKGVQLLKQQAYYPALFSILAQKRYDLIQASEESMLVSAFTVKWASKQKIPTLLYQGMYQPYSGANRILQRLYNLWAIPLYKTHLTYALAKTRKAQAYLHQLGISPVNRFPVGLDPTHLNIDPEDIDDAFTAFTGNFDYIILYLGILEDRRNPLFTIKLLEELSTRINVGLAMIGTGPAKKETDNLIAKLGLQDKVFRKDAVPHTSISQYFRKANLFLLPSSYEIYGMVLMEALYFNVPVVATDTPGAADILCNDSYGTIMSDLNVQKWADACQHYLPGSSQKENALHDYIVNNFNWDFLADKYIEIFEKCCIDTQATPADRRHGN